MPSKNKAFFLQQMSSTCTDKSSLKAKIAMISLFGDSLLASALIHKLLLLLEYLQLLSPILLFALFFQQKQETALPKSFLFFARIINPGLWLPFDQLSAVEVIFLSGLFLLTISKYLLLAWLIYKFKLNKKPQELLIKVWKALFNIQGRVLFLYMSFFWVNAAIISRNLSNEWIEEDGLASEKKRICVSLFAIILDFAFSVLIYARYYYMLPMKTFLSGKDNAVEMITLAQKFVLQILVIFLPLNSQGSVWAVTLVNLGADMIRNLYFFRTLPLYNIQALNYQAIVLMVLSSLNLACLASIIGKSFDSNSINFVFFVYLWALISVLTITISREYVKDRLWKVICDPSVESSSLFLHRISAINQLKYYESTSLKTSWASLAKASVNNNLKDLLKVTAEEEEAEFSINDKKSTQVVVRKYLEKLLVIHPNNEKIQLYAAHYFAKKSQKYGDAVKMLTALIFKGSSNNIKLNAELLLIQIQNKLQEKSAERNSQSQIDPTSYLQEQGLVFQLESVMLQQANAQIRVCEEVKKNSPDTFVIHKKAQIFNKLRGKNVKNCKKLFKEFSEANLEPLLLYAHYFLSLNHSLEDSAHYLKIYTQRAQKYQKYFDQQDLCQKNLFQAENWLYILSGHKATAGDIIFAPKPIGGVRLDAPMDSTIMSRIAPCKRSVFAQFYQQAAESYDETHFNKQKNGCIYHQEGYLIEVAYHLNIHPYVTQGFYFVLFLRPLLLNRDLILVLENGDIDCGTKGVSEKLGLLTNTKETKMLKNLKNLSEELVVVNKAFNMVAFPQRYNQEEGAGDLTKAAAQELYELYKTQGRDIWLSSLSDPTKSALYHCKITSEIFGSKIVKTLILEENVKASKDNSKSVTSVTMKKLFFEEGEDETRLCEEDEKEHGWINFKPLTSPKKVQTLRLKSEEETFADSQRTQEEGGTCRFNMESDRKLLFPDIQRRARRSTQLPIYQEKGLGDEIHSKKGSSFYESTSKESSKRKKVASLFALSLKSKHYSKIFKGVNILLFLFLIIFLMGQFIMIAIVNSNLENFKTQKDVLRTFQLRNFFLISLEGSARVLYDIGVGAFNTSGIRTFARGTAIYKGLAHDSLTNLTKMNQKLLLSGNLLSEEISSLLWEKDIPIYFTYFGEHPQSYVEENTFVGIDRIITAGATVVNYNGTNFTAVKDSAHFLFRNSLNDMLVKSQSISNTIINFLNSQRDKISKRITEFFIVELVLMIVLLGMFILGLWKEYHKEARNLSALCRIGNKKIDETLRGFVRFKEMIEEQKSLSLDLQIIENNYVRNEHNRHHVSREASKSPNHKGLHRKYYIYIAICFAFLVALVGLVTVGVNLTMDLLDSFKTEQEQIYFLDYLRTRAALSRQAARELAATNNTGRIENKVLTKESLYLVDELKQAKAEIYTKLLDEKTVSKIPAVKDVLLGDVCKVLASANATATTFFCQILTDAGQPTGLVYLLGAYEDALRNALRDYKRSDLTAKSLQNLQKNLYNLLPSYFNIVASGALALSDMIDGQLEEQLKENNQEKRKYLIACSFVVVAIGVLVWIFILRKLKEGVNQFKNVLKVFPAEVVLSSFILRIFLRKTSKYSFDSFKF